MSKTWTRTLAVVMVMMAVIVVATPKRVDADVFNCVQWLHRIPPRPIWSWPTPCAAAAPSIGRR